MKNTNSFFSKLVEGLKNWKLGEPITLWENGENNITMTIWGQDENHPAYGSISILIGDNFELKFGTKAEINNLANANKNRLINENLSESELFDLIKGNLASGKGIPISSAIMMQEKEPTESEMDSILTSVEKMMTTDEGLIKAIQATFGGDLSNIDPKLLTPQPIVYSFKDKKNPEITHKRLLSSNTFNLVGGELVLVNSVNYIYVDITAEKPTGIVVFTTYNSVLNKETKINILKSFKMSKLGLSFGMNFSSFLPKPSPDPITGVISEATKKKHKEDKAVLEKGNEISEGDPVYKNGEKQDFNFGLEHIKIHSKLMITASRKLSMNFQANPSIQIPF